MQRFENKTVIVTGGGGGIGGATSRRFGREGGRVAVFDLNLEAQRESLRISNGPAVRRKPSSAISRAERQWTSPLPRRNRSSDRLTSW